MQRRLLVTFFVASWLLGFITREARDEGVEPKSYPVLSGVGLALAAKDGGIFAFKIVANSPADKSGLIAEGARLVSVEANGKETLLDGKTVGEAASLIRGPVGTEVVLSVLPPNTQKVTRVILKREPLELPGVPDSSYQDLIGKPVPKLTLSSLAGTQTTQLSDHHGKIVVLDFWASWCPTCFAPVSKMQTISEENPSWSGKVELMTVSVDSDISKALAIIDEQKWHKTRNLAIEFADLKKIGVSVLPVIIVIAPDGTIATMAGAHAVDIEREVESLMVD